MDITYNIDERITLAIDRIKQIKSDEFDENNAKYKDYFDKVSEFILMCYEKIKKENDLSFDEKKCVNHMLYEDILPENYDKSYANPTYATAALGNEFGKVFSFLYSEIRSIIVYLVEKRYEEFAACIELFLEIYNKFTEDETPDIKYVKESIYYFMYDYADIFVATRIKQSIDPSYDFATDIIMNSDLSDISYLYKYGEYIGDNEIKMAKYFADMPKEKVMAMAKTYVDGFINGFKAMRIDITPKKSVNIRYSIGQERMIYYAIKMFEEYNLKPVIFRYSVERLNRRLTIRTGYVATPCNKQYEYDHRMDEALFVDKALLERKLEIIADVYEKNKQLAAEYAGPAVVETFGENPFKPEIKDCVIALDKKQQSIQLEYQNKNAVLTNKYIPRDKYSFTIIAYPIPEIGENFDEIFDEIIKVNTLDNELYKQIQTTIIDELNNAKYVHVVGCGDNKTDIKVMLHELSNPDKETKFENCLADVNIPVGEVFTSPVLTGTDGILNVSQVYLNELKYNNLTITFKDGKIADYNCDNFKDDAANKTYIKENLMFNHETLPIGEFAIGTNTTAYVMSHKFDILYKLPILIVEKMGPHFAVGDTCYSYSEDARLYNPDGKEIIAKDNECSILRKCDDPDEQAKAYFNCHTDITIPYEEIGYIAAVHEDGTSVNIIENGRFVLPGCEKLNEPFE